MDIQEIRKWHKVFKREGELFEIRLLGDRTYSGYFYDVEQAIEKLQPFDTFNIYFTVNEVKQACASRSQFGSFQQVKGTATSKQDIEHRWFIPIDIDCERPSGVSSTDEEKGLAHKRAGDVYRFLKANGFSEPIVCDSSSGYHIFLPVDMENTPEVEQAVKSFLDILGNRFTDEHVKIDNVLFDANRIVRLPGTFGRKGRDTEERPHRLAKILSVPEKTVRMTEEFLEDFNNRYKLVVEQPQRHSVSFNGGQDSFSLRSFIREHGISVQKEIPLSGGGTKYILTECIFDSGHKAPDAALFELPSGAISYKCFHQSCSCYGWKDVRLRFDPHAYDQRNAPHIQPVFQRSAHRTQVEPEPQIKAETPEIGKKWKFLRDIQDVSLEGSPRMRSGFNDIDFWLGGGLFLSETTILSGINGSGKSSWLNTLILNVIDAGYKAALWTGELQDHRLKRWLVQAAAGDSVVESVNSPGKFYTPAQISERIVNWIDDRFMLYNNGYSSNYAQILADLDVVVKSGCKLIILDNLFALDLEGLVGDENERQKRFILSLVDYAKSSQTHIILVAHPRKVVTFLRKEDILGTSALQNAVDNIFIIHRVGNDFERRGTELFGPKIIQPLMKYGNVIEICKNREYGSMDKFVGMYYDERSRRFYDENSADLKYGWVEVSVTKEETYSPTLFPVDGDSDTSEPFSPQSEETAPF